jgi:methionyl-tRNA synthetase
MRECPFGSDGNFSEDRFTEIYNSDLANNLGNLYSRTISMCMRYFEGRLEGSANIAPTDWRSGIDLTSLATELSAMMARFEYSQSLQLIWSQVLDTANRYIQNTEPFKLIKTDRDACRVVLANLADAIRVIAILIKPFLPATAEIFYKSFNFGEVEAWEVVEYNSISTTASRTVDWNVTAELVDGKPQPLFPKIQAPV